jgi:hypothetical protein
MSCINVLNINSVMAAGPFMGCSRAVSDIMNSKRRPDAGQLVLMQCTAVICRLDDDTCCTV